MNRSTMNPADILELEEEFNTYEAECDEPTLPADTDGEVDIQASLDALFGTISQYPLQNVLQRTMQGMVTAIARAQHLSDRIELGDAPVADLNGQRPQMDTNEQDGPRLTERQYEILLQCQNDEVELVAALLAFKTFYVTQFAEQPQYAIAQNARGGWDALTDYQQALAHEYRREHQNWLKRQESPKDTNFSAQGAELLRQDAAKRAQALAGQL